MDHGVQYNADHYKLNLFINKILINYFCKKCWPKKSRSVPKNRVWLEIKHFVKTVYTFPSTLTAVLRGFYREKVQLQEKTTAVTVLWLSTYIQLFIYATADSKYFCSVYRSSLGSGPCWCSGATPSVTSWSFSTCSSPWCPTPTRGSQRSRTSMNIDWQRKVVFVTSENIWRCGGGVTPPPP